MRKFLHSRLLSQFAFFAAQNPFLKNIFTGDIYRGSAKQFCTPGLNCYSCPAAATSCPVGTAQLYFSGAAGTKHSIGLFVTGFLLVAGMVFGRLICGYVCPMGLLQDLIYKIKSPKAKPKLRYLKYVKYLVLALFVVILPMFAARGISGVGQPWFCKYLCPSGTIFAALPILAANETLRDMTGWLFVWKAAFAFALMSASVFIYRFFCRVFCPLGAFYALFNKFAIVKMRCDKSKCVSCRKCEKSCNVCINPAQQPNSPECIRCGNCVRQCPYTALTVNITERGNNGKFKEDSGSY